jgi:hypothetical protein
VPGLAVVDGWFEAAVVGAGSGLARSVLTGVPRAGVELAGADVADGGPDEQAESVRSTASEEVARTTPRRGRREIGFMARA